jgi:hypothetical protein
VAKDKAKERAEDLEVSADKAGEVKGGMVMPEPGSSPRSLLVHSRKHRKHGKHNIPGPAGGMPHE